VLSPKLLSLKGKEEGDFGWVKEKEGWKIAS